MYATEAPRKWSIADILGLNSMVKYATSYSVRLLGRTGNSDIKKKNKFLKQKFFLLK